VLRGAKSEGGNKSGINKFWGQIVQITLPLAK